MRPGHAVTAVMLAALTIPAALSAAPRTAGVTSETAEAAATGTVTVNAVGDFGTASTARSVFAGLGARPGDLTMALGDLAYGTTLSAEGWCDLVKAGVGEGYPFQLIAGNHESNGLDGSINDFAACLPNQLPGLRGTYAKQWTADFPKTDPMVRLIGLSPGIPWPEGTLDYSRGSARYQWTAAAIDGARTAGIPWVVVGMHVPCLSAGQYSCDGAEDLADLLVEKRVDLVLSGHEHLYQRTHQLALAPGCPGLSPGTYTAACVVDSDTSMVRGRGTVFATVGTGGINLRAVNTADAEWPYFGAASGSNQSPSYGFLSLSMTPDRLSAQFRPVGTGTFSDAFTLDTVVGPSNEPPTASMTSACTDLACAFDGGGSTDSDGVIAAYSWTFGDGTTGSGVRPSHGYASAGTYTVGLTVTDDDGATALTTRSVTVTSSSPPSALAADSFARTSASGWGTAEAGGAWTTQLNAGAAASVAGGVGLLTVPAGRSATTNLGTLGSRTDLSMSWALDKVATGSGLYMAVAGRMVGAQGDYRAKVRHYAGGNVGISLVRTNSASAETALTGELLVPGLTLAAGERVALRLETTGTSPTTVRARLWRVGSPEPTTWQRSATDSTAALQAAGGPKISAYLSGAATNGPIQVSVDDVLVRAVP